MSGGRIGGNVSDIKAFMMAPSNDFVSVIDGEFKTIVARRRPPTRTWPMRRRPSPRTCGRRTRPSSSAADQAPTPPKVGTG